MTKHNEAHDAAVVASYEAMALIDACEAATWRMIETNSAQSADSLARVLKLARDKMAEVHDQLERSA